MKKLFRFMIITTASILAIWIILTIWAELPKGSDKEWILGNNSSNKKALVVYNPDLFYNLDEQVCKAAAEVLAEKQYHVTVTTVAAAKSIVTSDYNLYIVCANTYNWRPDWPTTSFIKSTNLKDKHVMAITLGSGSTKVSQKHLEEKIKKAGGHLLASRSLWLMRPNDETRIKEKNVKVGISMTKSWVKEVIQ